jgi:hypothetical protein
VGWCSALPGLCDTDWDDADAAREAAADSRSNLRGLSGGGAADSQGGRSETSSARSGSRCTAVSLMDFEHAKSIKETLGRLDLKSRSDRAIFSSIGTDEHGLTRWATRPVVQANIGPGHQLMGHGTCWF